MPSVFDHIRSVFDPYAGATTRSRERARGFAISNFIGGSVAAFAVFAYVWAEGSPSSLAWIAFIWLMSPLALSILPRCGLALEACHAIAVFNLAALVTFLAIFTGGLSSFLIAWLFILPVEAALSGSRRVIYASIGLVASALVLLLALGAMAWLPPSRVPAESWALLFALATLAAVIYAGALAINIQRLYQRVEDEAHKGEARYRFLADNALDMIIHHRHDGSMAFVSPASLAILGYQPSELLALPPLSLIHRADRKEVEIALNQASYYGADATLEFRMQHRAGHYVWLEMRCRPVVVDQLESDVQAWIGKKRDPVNDPNSEPYEIIAVARDISSAKSYEQELLKARDEAEIANQSKTRFLANISHELRTPLNAIIGFSDMMKQQMFGPLGDSHYTEYSSLINESGEHLLDLINDLLDMSKVEAGKYNLKREKFFMPLVIESCLRLIHLQAKRAGVRLQVDLPPSLPHIEADRRACKQMLLNLLSNAVKFTPKGGTIAISSGVVDDMLVLEVKDNGIGIPPQALQRLGQPFEQVEATDADQHVSRAQAGTGLGLALVRSLAQLHGGDMEIASKLGEGTLVQVSFPLSPAKSEEPDEQFPLDRRDYELVQEKTRDDAEAALLAHEAKQVGDEEKPIVWPRLKGAA